MDDIILVKCAERHCKRLLQFTQIELDRRLKANDPPRCIYCFGHRRSKKQIGNTINNCNSELTQKDQ